MLQDQRAIEAIRRLRPAAQAFVDWLLALPKD
jgi:hypothetical protein